MSQLDYVVNGATDVIDAVLECIGTGGTLLVPTHTGQLTDPIDWNNPPIRGSSIEKVRTHMNVYDVRRSIPRNRGIVSIVILLYPNVCRSDHPMNSVAAVGKYAQDIVATHPLHASEGIDSPVGKLYSLAGHVLLLGPSLKSCTALHLAEFIADVPYLRDNNIRVLSQSVEGHRFVQLEKYPSTSEFFDKLVPLFEEHNCLRKTVIGSCQIMLLNLRVAIDVTVQRLKEDPTFLIKP
jgi:aminoglycoside 3-N-acetyltransferase